MSPRPASWSTSRARCRSSRTASSNPDRLWIDLIGTRLHPNLEKRVFPVGDGLLEQVRIAKNRDDVIRVVLDFKDVWEHQVFYLENPTRARDRRPRAESGADRRRPPARSRPPTRRDGPAAPEPGDGSSARAAASA